MLVASDTGLHAFNYHDDGSGGSGVGGGIFSLAWSRPNACAGTAPGASPAPAPALAVACDQADIPTCLVGYRDCLVFVSTTNGHTRRREWVSSDGSNSILDGSPVSVAFADSSFWVATSRSLNRYALLLPR